MKTVITTLALALMMSACTNAKKIGQVNMISTRNIDSKMDYVLIKNYVGGSKKELRRLKADDLEEAINNVVKATPGGEFLKNVKIYVVNGKKFAVEGDVWGYPLPATTKK